MVVGAGFIGLEAAENLAEAGRRVTVVELAGQVLTPLDPEMARPLERELRRHRVDLVLGQSVTAIGADSVTLSDGAELPADMVVLAIGVRPDAGLATAAGLAVGPRGASPPMTVNARPTRTSGPWAMQSRRPTASTADPP